ncbi:MAG: hypothetical protein MJZ79_08130 [Paludibacteraceae bacterium]|nr:hypothetical protein [Paludibacteraceae bacterium]
MKNNFSKWDVGGGSQSIIQGLNLFTSRNLFKSLKSILMVVALLSLSSNVWGASPVTGSYTFGGSSVSGWSASPQTTYCNLYYSGKNSATTIKNTNISNIAGIDFSKVSNPSIEITVSGICNSGTNTYTVSLINSSGTVLVSGTAQSNKLGSGSEAKKANSSTVTMTPVEGVTGYQIYIGTKCCLTGTSYSLTYEEVTVTPVTSLILSEAGNETDLKSGKNVGDSYPLPSTTSASCGNKTFVGWSTEEILVPGTEPTSNFYKPGDEVTLAANNTFYAVFADASSGGTIEETVDICSIARTTIAAQETPTTVTLGGTAYEIEGTPISLTATKGTNNWPVLNYHATNGVNLRFYKTTSTVTFTAASPAKIKRIEFLNNAETPSNMANISATDLSDNVWSSVSGESSVTFTYSNSDGNYTTEMWIINVTYTTSGTSYSNYATSCVECEHKVTITKGAESNGTFTLSRSGDNVCIDDDATIIVSNITPAEHYHIAEVTTTNGTVTGPADGKYTVTVTDDAMIGVTFEQDAKVTVTWNVNGATTTAQVFPGETAAAPANPENIPTCANTFMGWSTSTLTGTGHSAPADLFSTTSPAITEDITFNAVFAMAVGGGQDAKYSKLTDVSVLKAGDKIVITGVKNETLYGMKAYVDQANNCLATDNAVTLDGDGNIASLSGACELTLGGSAGAWTLFDGTYYLYAAGTATSGTNYMKGQTTADDACLWTIAYNSTVECSDVISVKNEKTPCLRHNNDGSNNIFSCYKSDNTMGVIALYRKPGTTYSNYVTSCATYTVTWRSNDYEIRVDADKAPGTVLTAPTVDDVRDVNTKAACNDHLVGWMPSSSTTNPKYTSPDTAPSDMVGQQVTVTGNVVYHAVYADVAGE